MPFLRNKLAAIKWSGKRYYTNIGNMILTVSLLAVSSCLELGRRGQRIGGLSDNRQRACNTNNATGAFSGWVRVWPA